MSPCRVVDEVVYEHRHELLLGSSPQAAAFDRLQALTDEGEEFLSTRRRCACW